MWQILGSGSFASRIIKFGCSINMIYHVDTICSRVFYVNLSLKGDTYIYEISSPLILPLFCRHYPNKPLSLEDMTIFNVASINIHHRDCNGVFISLKIHWHLFIWLDYRHNILVISIDLAKIVNSYTSATSQIKLLCTCTCFD